jgi:pyridinium-3,5-bisthiocarboxylic acid mononucleotide nickel chelatase
MRLAYFDCPSGAAGDMIMGALVDAGAPFEALQGELAKLRLPGFTLERREAMKGVFRATKVDVHLHGDDHAHADAHGRHDHPHRNLRSILELLAASGLDPAVKADAARIFTRLAEAEARVHGTSVHEVHFHEVGAVDAIVDVTGACIGLHLLGVDAVHCSALPVGGGFVGGAHGRMPVPAPGTAELLKGFPVVDTGVRRELVTPTGAAILTTLSASAGAMPAMTVEAVGYGAGTVELETPNIIRVFLGRATEVPGTETIVQVETTVDDMQPQLWEAVMERLFDVGALDVYLTPVTMKKSRPGIVLTALCAPDRVTQISRVLFEESPTIGVRWTAYERQRLERETVTLTTGYGPVPFKVSRHGGRVVTATPEFAEVRRIAKEKGLPAREVLDQARADGRRLLQDG